MKIRISVIVTLAMLLYATTVSATRSPFDNATNTLYEEATSFFESKNYLAAISFYKDFLKYKPSDLEASDERVRMARQNIALASYILRLDDAASLLTEYKEAYPYTQNLEQIELYLGILEFDKGKYKAALKRLQKIKAENLTDEEFKQLLFYRGYCLVQQGKYEEACYQFSQLLKMPENTYTLPSHYYYGYCQFYQGNYKTALDHLILVKNKSTFASTTAYLMCQCYYHLGDCEKSVLLGNSIIKNDSKSKYLNNVRHVIASCQFKNKEYDKALENMLLYTKSNKKIEREDLYIIGMCYFKAENPKKAIEYLSKVTKNKDILSQNSYFHIAMSYLALGDKKNARLAYESASMYDFDKTVSCDALYNYALITYELSYAPFNESVSAFERFLKEYPDSEYCTKVYEYLVNVYLTTKNYSDAYKSIQSIEKKSSSVLAAEQRVLFGMGTTQVANRKYKDAAESFKTLLSQKSYNQSLTTRSYFWYGECLYKLDKYTEAASNYNTYINKSVSRTEEEYALAHYGLGYAYLKLGRKSESNNWFRKFTMIEGADKQMVADAYNRIGDNFFSERNFEQAKQAYSSVQAIASSVKGADYAMYQKSIILGLQNRHNDKISTLETLISTYPKSDWSDDALFEIGMSYMALGDNVTAIEKFKKVASTYPKTNPLVRQSKLQNAMLYYNEGDVDKAISLYKEVAVQFPGTEESQTSLESLENIMVENNRVKEYTEIAKAVNKGKSGAIAVKEDSLTYKAAEKLYFKENYDEATESFKTYISKYPDGKYASKAKYYLADCYYRLGKKDEAANMYKSVAADKNEINREETLLRLSALCYEREEWDNALQYYTELSQIGKKSSKESAKIGIMRTAYITGNYALAASSATEVIGFSSDSEILQEAKYKRMKSNIESGKSAIDDIKDLSSDTRTEYGAEAEYLLLQYYYTNNNYDACEKEFFVFVEKGTPHSYYLAKAFIVLVDCYIAQEKYFDARQYLSSLSENYTPAPDDIKESIKLRYDLIEIKESEQASKLAAEQPQEEVSEDPSVDNENEYEDEK